MDKIDINTAPAQILTQLPGIGIDLAYYIVNHRERHGWFTAWEELLGVKDFPENKLEAIKERAILSCPEDRPGQQQTACTPPRHLNQDKILDQRNSPQANTNNFSINQGHHGKDKVA
jgi:competence ComEA-like helix-hairpin-helix protein